MFLSNILILCVLVLYSCGVAHAKVCSDCVPLRSCQAALDLAVVKKNEESRRQFKNAFCGYENNEPKVCCSDFPVNSDSIENHPNLPLLPTDCGDIDGSRIVGGRVAKLYEFPWMVLISYNTRDGLQFQCGGSVISSKYILTAAHCVVPTKKIAGVRIGEFDILSRNDCQGDQFNSVCESNLQDILIDKVIIHPDYQGEPPVQYDIALLRLQTPIDFSYKNAGPVCLPIPKKLRNVDLGGKNATVAGWGSTEAGTDSSLLLKVDIPIRTGESCRQYYNKNSGPGTDRTDKILCAGEYKKDSCSGDSGGPMMIEDEYDGVFRLIQYGIVSYGPRQCGSTYPGVYTDVTKFVKWILDNLKP
ncbi:venom protease-like [Maniola hyperantus]|uniref:venom protease-like n=1 Tax=Aphantopus hyperantus TaxID=2795564 RepID=UPI001569EBA0|nr:venom protease-like [Maniola hyperantus]